MKSPDGATNPLWKADITLPRGESVPLNHVNDVDVCVIGAGISGLTAAYLAARQGLSVAVYDEGQIGDGQTARTSAHLASALDDRFFEIARQHGEDAARLAYESHAKAIDAIEEICKTENIDAEFVRVPGYLSRHPSSPPDILEKELTAAKKAGVREVEIMANGGMYPGPVLRFGRQARFHPLKYIVGLARALEGRGGEIYCGRRVIDVQGVDPQKGIPALVQIQDVAKPVTAKHIIVATNTPAPINDWLGIYLKQASYRTYAIAVTIPKGAVPDALYWDTADPYHYVRLQPGLAQDLLIVGGEDHKTGQFSETHAPFLSLQTWTRQTYPEMRQVEFRWSGQVQEPDDGLAFIGRAVTSKEEVYVITGDSGMGLTHGTLGALLITDLITGHKNAWQQIYDPSRKMLTAEFLHENANALLQYKDLLTPGQVKTIDEIPPGRGAVLREGMTKLAVYRDNQGVVHKCSAICTHLQCVVQWNPVEKTWDCPCHGSRFDPGGKVLMGPAITDLPQAE